MFKKSDKFDLLYLAKRALYLSHVAIYLKQSDLIVPGTNIKFVALNGDALKPCLVLRPNQKTAKALEVIVSAVPQAGFFKLTQFTPEKSNITTAEEVDCTPHYNSSICEDLVLEENEKTLQDAFGTNQNLKDAAILIAVWLKQRSLSEVKRESAHALNLLNKADTNSFQAIFLRNTPFLHQYDNVLCFHDAEVVSRAILSSAPRQLSVDFCLQNVPIFVPIVEKLLTKGLGDRLSLIGIGYPTDPRWDLSDSPTSYQLNGTLMIGLKLNPDNALSVIDKGPSSNTPEKVFTTPMSPFHAVIRLEKRVVTRRYQAIGFDGKMPMKKLRTSMGKISVHGFDPVSKYVTLLEGTTLTFLEQALSERTNLGGVTEGRICWSTILSASVAKCMAVSLLLSSRAYGSAPNFSNSSITLLRRWITAWCSNVCKAYNFVSKTWAVLREHFSLSAFVLTALIRSHRFECKLWTLKIKNLVYSLISQPRPRLSLYHTSDRFPPHPTDHLDRPIL
ncbi:unnamed protein product [Nesidiocoris tenuis]|uniref:Nucleolar protein 6 n=1 Tax=Nesidiocoris tenuis TaxID=355587 RepID=A0A6H5HSH0_9HEMI|nr:unnamed protein product [Nesidiocoris tenuis]